MGVVAAVMGLVKLPQGRAAAVADVRAPAAVQPDLPVRLRELGFLDGEEVEVLAAGISGGPLAVRIGGTTFALRIREAECVTVLTVVGGTAVPGPSAEQLMRYLRRNGIAAEPLAVELDGRNTGEAILAAAESLGCDLLIKGAYTQSRLRQMIFGGPTRHILAKANLPVLMAH